LFALAWESHGLAYGIGIEIDLWLARGVTVLTNIARAAWEDAARRYPALLGVLVTAAPAVLAERLKQPGREDADDIAERLAREVALAEHPALHRLDNSGALEEAGAALLRLIAGDKEWPVGSAGGGDLSVRSRSCSNRRRLRETAQRLLRNR